MPVGTGMVRGIQILLKIYKTSASVDFSRLCFAHVRTYPQIHYTNTWYRQTWVINVS